MLNGIDISHHNSNMKNPHDLNDLDFVIMKATEGVRFKDRMMPAFMNVLDSDMLYGFYHYARPELANEPEDEALHFVSYIKKYISNRSILALDVEGDALRCGTVLDGWCSIWAQVVEVETGILPLIYTSTSETKRFQATANLGCGLWAAKWGHRPTQKQCEPWPFWAIWQHTNCHEFSGVRVDGDIFNGDREQWMKYCLPEK